MAGFQILPTSNRPTIYDAVGQLLNSIQGNQAQAQQQAYQTQQQQAQAAQQAQDQARQDAQDAADKTAQDKQDAYDRLKDQIDNINSIDDPGQKAAAWKNAISANPALVQTLGYDPTNLPAPQPDNSGQVKSQVQYLRKLDPQHLAVIWPHLTADVRAQLPDPTGLKFPAKPMTTYEQQHLDLERSQANAKQGQEKKQSYDPTNVATFVEHPAVKGVNQKLRDLDAQQQRIASGAFTINDPTAPGGRRPPTQQEIAQAMIPIHREIAARLAERNQVVNGLRKQGVKLAADPNDMTSVQRPTAAPVAPTTPPPKPPVAAPQQPQKPPPPPPLQQRRPGLLATLGNGVIARWDGNGWVPQ